MLLTLSRNSQERKRSNDFFHMCRLVVTQGLSLNGSRTIAPEENCPPNPRTNPKPTQKPNRGTVFLGGNCLVVPNPKTNHPFADASQNGRFRNIHRKAPVLESLFNKVADLETWRPATLSKRDSSTSVFLWILRNSYERLFYRKPQAVASVDKKTKKMIS